jgi:2-C-methyl-D-erythritol 4-phosphate cytidylyltransferase
VTTPDGPEADVAVIMPAAGAGVRLGSGVPKAFQPVAGEPLLVHAARGALSAGCIGCLVLAVPAGREDEAGALVTGALPPSRSGARVPPQVIVVPGGAQRQGSVAVALAAVPPRFDIVLVHDAARALAPAALVADVVAAVRAGHDAVIPVLPVTDTVTRVDASGRSLGPLDRAGLRAVQTPQGFRRAVLRAAHAAAVDATATDDAGLVARLGVPVHTVPGSPLAFKVTSPYDLVLAEQLLRDGSHDRPGRCP